ncbi:MAG: phosphatase PAP2 family protein, partial [Acidobacteria bacterium]|nr:phosphatase PAP2 family protein [Acidobacteriota bacterium]
MLAGEALLNSLALSTTIQYATGRARPLEGGGSGNFGRGGTSFPSNHAAAVWSLASVIAHEYPGPLTKILAYGMASAVSVSRVRAKEHFPSDVVIGSAIGWFVGQQVYRAHHNPGLRGSTWATPAEALSAAERETHGASASTFVPLDSWVYSVIERLAGMGYVRSGMSGLKPYTRVECARLTEEASEQIHEMIVQDRAPSESATILVAELEKEFAYEMDLLGGGANRNIQLESIYSRATSISGPPLTDALHFGQTISYDFGRPFRRGFNSVTGGAFFATAGRFGIYVRGEFQHSPSAPAL